MFDFSVRRDPLRQWNPHPERPVERSGLAAASATNGRIALEIATFEGEPSFGFYELPAARYSPALTQD
jgi:hypothetical protein